MPLAAAAWETSPSLQTQPKVISSFIAHPLPSVPGRFLPLELPNPPYLSLVLYPFLMDGEHLGASTLRSSVDSQPVAQSLVDEPSSLGSLWPSEGLERRMLGDAVGKNLP